MKVVNLLALDGGGTRGFFTAYFLKKFCAMAGINGSKMFDAFQVIGGTSIGGIQSCGYAWGMSPDDMLAFFKDTAPWVFTVRTAADTLLMRENASEPSNSPHWSQKIGMVLQGDPFYKSYSQNSNYGDVLLKRKLKEIFGDHTMEDLKTNVIVPTYNKDTKSYKYLSNCDLEGFSGKDYLIRDAALSTGSAPLYFPAAFADGFNNMDGGIFWNSPALTVYMMAKCLYPWAEWINLISVGTGRGEFGFHKDSGEGENDPENLNVLSAVAGLVSLIDIGITGAQEGVNLCLDMISKYSLDNLRFYRFQVSLDTTRDTELDTTSGDFFDYLEDAVDTQFNDDLTKISGMIARMNL